jgi:polysaccharide biosynthesis transport protein
LLLPGEYHAPSPYFSALPAEGVGPVPPFDLRGLIGGLLQRWKLIIASPLVLLMLTAGVLRMVPPRFQSSVELLMFDPQQASVATPGQQPISERLFDTEALATEIAVIQSESLALRVAKDLDLGKDSEFQRHSRLGSLLGVLGISGHDSLAALVPSRHAALDVGGTAGSPGGGRPSAIPGKDYVVATAAELLAEHIRVERVPFSYVLTVTATSHSPEMAQRLAAAVVDDYLAGLREQRHRALQQVAVWLKAQLAGLKSRIEETEDSIGRLKAESGLGDTGKGNVIDQQMADLNTQLMQARAEIAEKRAQLDQARQRASTAAGLEDMAGVTASSMIGELRQQQSRLRASRARVSSQLGDLNPEVVAIDAELAGVRRAINGESAHILADLQSGYDVALRREQSLQQSLQRLAAAQNGSGDYVKLQQLQRIAGADSKLYDSYLAQYNEINTRESLEAFGPRIISSATVPTAPSFPRATLLYLAAGVLGLGIGFVLAFLLDYFRAGVNTSAQAQNTFGHPVVGALPLVKQRWFRRSDGIGDLVQAVVDAPMCPLGEAVRAVRIALHLANPTQTPMVVLVTSSLPGEGKSSIAMLLAASSAGAGESTVVVDCDLRSRTISQQFDSWHPGLTELLTGDADIAAVALRHPIARCDVITAGSQRGAPADLLISRRLVDTIARLRERYAYVIVDAPPLLAAIDAIALATFADKILITIDGARTRSQTVAEAFRLLRPETDRIAGMVFNKVAPSRLRRYAASVYY